MFIVIVRANAGIKSINYVDDQSTLKTIPENSHHLLLGQLALLATGWASSVVIAGSDTSRHLPDTWCACRSHKVLQANIICVLLCVPATQ